MVPERGIYTLSRNHYVFRLIVYSPPMRMTLPGVEVDRFDWPDERVFRFKGGRYVTLKYTLVHTVDQLEEMRSVAKRARRLFYDTETSGLNPHKGARIVGHALGVPVAPDVFRAWYVPVRHWNPYREQLAPELVAPYVADALDNEQHTVTGHHLKFDESMAKADEILIRRVRHDTAVQATIYDENAPRFGLKPLADYHLFKGASAEEEDLTEWLRRDARSLKMNYKKPTKGDPLRPTYLQRFGYARSPIKLCGSYACHDVFYTWGLEETFLPHVLEKYRQVYERDMAISQFCHWMEWRGLDVNPDEIQRAYEATTAEVEHWLGEIRRLTKDPAFEIKASSLSALFYDQLKMEPPKFTKKDNKPSTDLEARQLLEKKYPEHGELMKSISRHAKAEKLRSTYTIAFLRHVTPERKIHGSYNQIERKEEGGVPVTGRMNSSDPNLQNITKKPIHLYNCLCEKCIASALKEGRKLTLGQECILSVRRYFIIRKGWLRAYIDLSQIELRVLAWLSQDPKLLWCYANDLDVHQITADEVTGGDRDIAKQVNFGNNYGMTEIGLAKRLTYYAEDPDRALVDAAVYLKQFFVTYAGIPPYKRKLANHMRRNDDMFVSPLGRPRRIPLISSTEIWERERAERMMMSAAVSGLAADLIKEIMIRCGAMLERDHPQVEIAQAIHDEIAFDMPIKGCATVLPKLMHCFTDWPMFEGGGVPIKASCEIATTSWEDKRELAFLSDGTFKLSA